MKRKELIVVVGVGVAAAIISFIVSGALFGSPNKNPIKVPVVNKISSDFPLPQTDDTYKKFFNSQANNPTQLIRIGGNNNTTPFRGVNGQ
jgi:hypothetical protein